MKKKKCLQDAGQTNYTILLLLLPYQQSSVVGGNSVLLIGQQKQTFKEAYQRITVVNMN